MKRKRRSPAVILFAVVLILGAAEIAGRLVGMPTLPHDPTFAVASEWSYPDWIDRDRELFWRYRPSRKIDHSFMRPGTYTINSHGFRGPEYTLNKPQGVTRVVCLGESTTFGLGITDENTWPRQLEKHLSLMDSLQRQWQVLNLGVTNYTSYQGVILGREMLMRLQPDYVVYCFGWADHQPAANGVSDDRIDLTSWSVSASNYLGKVALYRWGRIFYSTLTRQETDSLALADFTIDRRVSSTDFASNIEKLAREVRQSGAVPIMLTAPIAWPAPGLTDTTGVYHLHHRYRRLARFGAVSGGGRFAELANAFDQHREFYDRLGTENELFNARGHEFTGLFVARYILGDTAITMNYGSEGLR